MPYRIVKNGSKYKVVNAATGAVKARGTTKAKAQSQVRFLNMIDKRRGK